MRPTLFGVVAVFTFTGCTLVDLTELQASNGGGGAASIGGASNSAVGGAGGVGGDGGGGGAGGATGPCPVDMVHASDDALGVSFCIDKTEVTQTKYLQFLLEVGNVTNINQPPECDFNVELTYPEPLCPTFDVASELPVYCIDWCDARAYCEWADKRLCRALDGTRLEPLEADVVLEEWHFGCTGGLAKTFPYGNAGVPGVCNLPEQNTPNDESDDLLKQPVGSMLDCEGGYPDMFDMQGNIAEWVDWCDPATDGTGAARCHARGGHTYGTAGYWSCANDATTQMRNGRSLNVGVRCCKDAEE